MTEGLPEAAGAPADLANGSGDSRAAKLRGQTPLAGAMFGSDLAALLPPPRA